MTSQLSPLRGLSLCIQGTLMTTLNAVLCLRFIPVYTGNTPNAINMSWYFSVYPCVYREHMYVAIDESAITRFIPVYTGNTFQIILINILSTVYPCVYREHSNYNILFYN